MAYTIFMSHGSTDVRWVKWLADQADQVGIQADLYEHDAQPGRNIAEKVKLRIQQSDAVVVLLTKHSVLSPYVQQEIGFAEAKGKLIIPLVQPGIDQRNLAMLQGREYVSFDFDNPGQAMNILVRYLLKLKQAKEGLQRLLAFAALIVAALALGGSN